MAIHKRAFPPVRAGLFSTTLILAFLVSQPFLNAQNTTESAAENAPPQPGQLANPGTQANNGNSAMQLPNTVSAPPFTVGDKFAYRVVQSFGLRGLLGAFVSASIGQGAGSPYAWGGGVEGYATRYASAFGGNLSRQSMAFVVESALHQDPRYFPSEGQPFKSRALNALKQVFVAKTDAGHSQFAYGRVISAFAAGQLVNAWQPSSTGTVGDGFKRGVYSLGGDLAYNFAQEFFPFTRPHSIRHRH
ncbi:MAG TPA: hypothetical protein VHZ55_24825 [Bryobacteraceae bacterium]|nr:hypothetical protein [Bryobacteraceae bacterium]